MLKVIGKYKADSNSKQNQLAQFPKCDSCGEFDSCSDKASASVASSVNVTGFVYNGNTYSITATAVTNTSSIAAQINAVISKVEIDPVVDVEYTGGVLTVKHIGDGTLSSILRSTGGALTTTRYCNEVIVCGWEIDVEGTISNVVKGSNSVALDNNPYDYTGTSSDATTAATLKTDLETALTAAGQSYDSVSVTVDNTSGRYFVKVYALGQEWTTQIGTQKFVYGGCTGDMR